MKDKVMAILNINSAPIKKMITEAKNNNMLYDVSMGRRSRTVVVTTNHQLYLSAVKIETLTNRLINNSFKDNDEDEEPLD